MTEESHVVHHGGCHCGAVRFEVEAPTSPVVSQCNCSICDRVGYLHLIVPRAQFRLVSGRELLSEYRFNTKTARHLFCSRCGVKSFYVPRSHPDGYSVNVRCIDEGTLGRVEVRAFDGQDWDANVHKLPPISHSK